MPRNSVVQTIDVAPLCLRADLGTFDEEQRTVDLIFSTGAAVERYDWMSGKRYLERLEISKTAIDLTRLNSGAPLLDSHSAWSIYDQIGAVVPGSARIEGGKALATVKFSARDAVLPIVRDVQDKILTSVSVGYRVTTYQETEATGNNLPIRTATRWTPFEVSLVSMPADIGAKVRREQIATNACELVTRAALDMLDADRLRRFRLARLRAS